MKKTDKDIGTENFELGHLVLKNHPMFQPLLLRTSITRHENNLCPRDGWAVVTNNGTIHCNPTKFLQSQEWTYILAHCLLHLGFGHFTQVKNKSIPWNVACDCIIAKFLADFKFGRPPDAIQHVSEELVAIGTKRSEEDLYSFFCTQGIPDRLLPTGTTPICDMLYQNTSNKVKTDWQASFGEGLALAVASAVDVVGGIKLALGDQTNIQSLAQNSKAWFINNYPLLGSLAATFQIIEDPIICQRLNISIAAVDSHAKEIFMNPRAGLDLLESRFVIAHELLHVGLRHDVRCQGRDVDLWNIACDYVINAWLVEMNIGKLPQIGLLYDPQFKDESAETIYDKIVTDVRRFRKLATLRGVGLSDILEPKVRDWWEIADGISLDDYYRNCLNQGLIYHQDQTRGSLPAGLIEEIRAVNQPAIPWDVELAQWFDEYFVPLQKIYTYKRLSRRQSVTPDIPRPAWTQKQNEHEGRTFGVVLDTSGSMDRTLLAKALGAIASYCLSRDVLRVRVIFCDALPYDQGYMDPVEIAEVVKVKGRGGTILQPGIDLLQNAKDFPKDGPVLIITDGFCDKIYVRRDHALLIPQGRNLPFVARGKVFKMK